MQQRQSMHFELLRSGQVNANEIAVMGYIYSFSEFCAPPTMGVMAKRLAWSERKLRYVIKSLVNKGVILRKYMAYKKVKLQLKSLEDQAKLIGIGMVKAVVDNTLKLKKKMSYRQKQTTSYRQKHTEPIENKTLLRIKTPGADFFRRTNKSAFEQMQELLKARASEVSI